MFAALAGDIRARGIPLTTPACILAGGETTVTLRGDGLGGRNQELALAFLFQIAEHPEAYQGVTFLSFGTDGNDGPTDAAGGWAAPQLLDSPGRPLSRIRADLAAALERNDSYHALDSLGALLRTGPTNTNVCDIQVLLVEQVGAGMVASTQRESPQ